MPPQNQNPIEQKIVTYNPFKMWGSWVGAVLYLVLSLFLHGSGEINSILFFPLFILFFPVYIIGTIIEQLFFPCEGFLCGLDNLELFSFIIVIISFIIGFLLGWAVHTLFRYINNKKNEKQ